jgi:HD-GYP domain-containing protein (c-di-GMP phosphodiesterase class II)
VLFTSRALTPEVFDSLDALVRLADEREGPEGHARAIATIYRRLALQLGLDEAAAERLYLAGLLHDVGKISVPDAVLAKRSELTATEWAQVKRHARLGAALAARMPAVADAAPAIEAHHERWDGSGYPRRLRGEQIPLEGRILGVADSYVAMLSERPFREQRSRGSALTSLWREAAILYDPNVVAALLLIAGQSDVELETLAAHALD